MSARRRAFRVELSPGVREDRGDVGAADGATGDRRGYESGDLTPTRPAAVYAARLV
jgi:hypothetical protein